MKRLPSNHFLTIGSIHQHWGNDWDLQSRYKLLQSATEAQRQKIQRTARKLFGLSVRCRHNPNHQLPRERYVLLLQHLCNACYPDCSVSTNILLQEKDTCYR